MCNERPLLPDRGEQLLIARCHFTPPDARLEGGARWRRDHRPSRGHAAAPLRSRATACGPGGCAGDSQQVSHSGLDRWSAAGCRQIAVGRGRSVAGVTCRYYLVLLSVRIPTALTSVQFRGLELKRTRRGFHPCPSSLTAAATVIPPLLCHVTVRLASSKVSDQYDIKKNTYLTKLKSEKRQPSRLSPKMPFIYL